MSTRPTLPHSHFPERLRNGYVAFMGERFARENRRYADLAETGQKPEILVVSCCDSRVSPEVIFDASPGRALRGPQRREPRAAL
jgi:carbonic anhydrase